MAERGLDSGWFCYPPSRPARLIPPIALAYIGDAVYEVAVRQYLLAQTNLRPHHLHRRATSFVSAKAQSKILQMLEQYLTEEEQGIVKQCRNAKSGSLPKNADVLEYRYATALEGLLGFLYCDGRLERLRELIDKGIAFMDKSNK